MSISWRSHSWAIVAWVAICSITFALPPLMHVRMNYYLHNGEVIPLWERMLMGLGEFVRLFQISIIFGTGAILLVISLAISSFSKRA